MREALHSVPQTKSVLAPEKASIPGKPTAPPLIEVHNLSVWYEQNAALTDVSYDLKKGEILAFIGPSGCGKTTALKCLNRMLDDMPGTRIEGSIRLAGKDIYSPDVDPPELRQQFGWVAQSPNPFALTIYENVAYGVRIHGLARDEFDMDRQVESCLRRADLWGEVKDTLHSAQGASLSIGQQQRLCIARALALNPLLLLMDEPTGSLDPIAAKEVEQLVLDLRGTQSIIVITHSMIEARRIADRVAMFYQGRLIEIGPTAAVFDHPAVLQTQNFIHGWTG